MLSIAFVVMFAAIGVYFLFRSFAATELFSDSFSGYATNTCMPDGTTFGPWKVAFAGFGCTRVTTDNKGKKWLEEKPADSNSAGETHAALTIGPSFKAPYTYNVTMQTNKQLRNNSTPNPWEVGWVVWNYSDNTHFYYFIPKANGWELGKEDPAYPGAQRFLASGTTPTFAVGDKLNVSIDINDTNVMTVSVNGTKITQFTDTERPYTAGNIGLYSEDAKVRFTSVTVNAASNPNPPPSGMRDLPDPLYGVTLDNESGISNAKLSAQVSSLKALPHMPTTRVVFDKGTTKADYDNSINTLQPISYLMGEVADSTDLKNSTTQQYHDTTAKWLQAYGDKIDIWEVGNEVNGNWTGPYPDVVSKIYDSYNQVKTAGKRSELTLWYNPKCAGDRSELDPVSFSNQYVPADMRNGLDYVTVSYYETQCNNYRPSTSELTTLFTQLHSLYPNSKLGFGEIGLPRPVSSTTLATAQSIANYYYGLNLNLSYYVGGYFWWYFAQDGVPSSNPMWQNIHDGFNKY